MLFSMRSGILAGAVVLFSCSDGTFTSSGSDSPSDGLGGTDTGAPSSGGRTSDEETQEETGGAPSSGGDGSGGVAATGGAPAECLSLLPGVEYFPQEGECYHADFDVWACSVFGAPEATGDEGDECLTFLKDSTEITDAESNAPGGAVYQFDKSCRVLCTEASSCCHWSETEARWLNCSHGMCD